MSLQQIICGVLWDFSFAQEEVIEMIGGKFGGVSGFVWAVC